MPTIIRHKEIPNGFAVVVTDFETGLTARFQSYRKHSDGSTTLMDQKSFSKETDAIIVFNDCDSIQNFLDGEFS